MLKDHKNFTKVLTCNCINNNLFKGKTHQSFTLMITLCVQSDLGPNCMPTLFQWSKTVCAILVEGIMRNISVKLFKIWTSGSGENVI